MAWNKRRRCLLYLPLLHCAVAPKPASRNQFADNDNPHAIPGTGTLAVTTVAALPDRAWMTGHPEVGQKIFGPFESGFDANHELLCAYEKVYVYGKRWPLEAPALAGLARASRPPFLEDGDVRGGGGVAWIGAAGTLTPLHYDLADGVLAQVLGSKRVWLFPPEAADACYLRSARRPGVDNWERQSRASLHGAAAAAAWPDLGDRRVADLGPGDALFLPSNWLHEVHARSPSVSLGWRVAATDGGVTHERNAGQKLERLAASVKSGRVSVEESLAEAMRDPQMMELFMQQMPSIVR